MKIDTLTLELEMLIEEITGQQDRDTADYDILLPLPAEEDQAAGLYLTGLFLDWVKSRPEMN